MADEEEADDEPKKKSSKLPLILGLVLAIAGGGGSFFAIYSGMILGGDPPEETAGENPTDEMPVPDVAFVEVEPLLIGIGRGRTERHLRFRAQLEVPAAERSAVEKVLPRVVDVMNTYLRAIEIQDLEDPSALVRLRAQLLRRVKVVTGPTRVNDLLIMEFVMS